MPRTFYWFGNGSKNEEFIEIDETETHVITKNKDTGKIVKFWKDSSLDMYQDKLMMATLSLDFIQTELCFREPNDNGYLYGLTPLSPEERERYIERAMELEKIIKEELKK